jgi:hypothetical protein
MKNLVAILAISATLFSCSNDNDSNNEQFFNLKEGNLWVYKEYQSDYEGLNPAFTGTVDSVRVTGTEVIDAKTYSVLQHSAGDYYEYVRVDENGHLVYNDGYVLHPGTDAAYTTTITKDYGTISYATGTEAEINVEGSSYTLAPYVGYISANNNIPSGIGNSVSYKEGVGIVVNRARFVAGLMYIEYRLASYQLN